jgi:adenylylsulfate kinase-like enzyme
VIKDAILLDHGITIWLSGCVGVGKNAVGEGLAELIILVYTEGISGGAQAISARAVCIAK